MVLAHLATLSQPASIRQIAHALELRHRGRRYLPRMHPEIEEARARWKRLKGAASGWLERNTRGMKRQGVRQQRSAPARRVLQRQTQLRAKKAVRPAQCKRVHRAPRSRAGEIRIWWRDESSRIATVTLFWCRMRRYRAWRAICLSAATAWATRCTATTCSRGSCDGAPMAALKGGSCKLPSGSTLLWWALFRYGPHGNSCCRMTRASCMRLSFRLALN